MRDLALWLDSTLPGLSMAILARTDESWEVVSSFHEDKTGATSRLNTVFSRLIAQAGVSISDINHLLMGVGPGSFTGIKIGMAWALGFAAGFDIIQPISQASDQDQGLDISAGKSTSQGKSKDTTTAFATDSRQESSGVEVAGKLLRFCGLSALELAVLGVSSQPVNLLLKVTSAHGFLLRANMGDFSPDKPREIAVKIEDLSDLLDDSEVHLACPWPEVSGILSNLGRKVIEHSSLRLTVQQGLIRYLNQKDFQWGDEFPLPRYLKLSTAEEKLKLTEKGE